MRWSRQGAGRERERERERERQDSGHMPLFRSMSGMFWGPWAKARLVSLNHKGQCFGKVHRDLI